MDITQAELAEFAAVRAAKARCEELREGLLGRLGRGAKVQPGKLSIRVAVRVVAILSWGRLAEVPGEDRVARLRGRISWTLAQCLRVVERPGK